MWGHSESLSTSNIFCWVFTIPCSLGPALFVGFSLPLFFFIPFIMFVFWMFCVHPIKFPFHIVICSPIPIFVVSGSLILRFLDSPIFNIVHSLNITLVGFPSFFWCGSGLCYLLLLEMLQGQKFFYLTWKEKFLVK